MIVKSKAPLRISFAGGGSDLPSYYKKYDGIVINATINSFAHCSIEARDSEIIFEASDLGIISKHKLETEIKDSELKLHQGIYYRIVKDFNNSDALAIAVCSSCDAPAGSGLGSSSTLTVAIIQAYSEYLNLSLSKEDIARLACKVERQDLGLSGGKQDHYAAAYGGINHIEFSANDVVTVNPIELEAQFISKLESSLVIYYTGRSRESANIIDKQNKDIQAENSQHLDAIHQIKKLCPNIKKALLDSDLVALAKCLEQSWQAKKQSCSLVTNEFIDDIYKLAKENGALAGKISGAGGGGFMLFLVEANQKAQLIKSLEAKAGFILNCEFETKGCHSWKLDSVAK